MRTIKNPTKEQIQLMMDLISTPAIIDEESVGDRFYFKFMAKYLEWLKENNSRLFKKIVNEFGDEDSAQDVDQAFWPNKQTNDPIGYEAFVECVKYIYSHEDALSYVCKEIKDFMSDERFINYKRWPLSHVNIEDVEHYESLTDMLLDSVDYDISSDDDFDFDAALANKKDRDDDEDFDFDAALEPKAPKNMYFLDSIHEDGEGGADLAILPASGDEEDFENTPFIHVDDLSELNGVDEGDYFYYDEETHTITPANNSDYAKHMSDESARLRQELIKQSEGFTDNDEDEDDDDFDFDAALGPISKKAKKLLGDLAASGAQIHGVAPGGGIGGRLNVDKNGNIKGGDDWSRLIGDLTRDAANTESKNAKSGSFDKQKGWKDVPDFDPKAKAAEIARNKKEEEDGDIDFDHDSFEKDFKAMLGDDFDFMRDIDD